MGKWKVAHNFKQIKKYLNTQAAHVAEATARDIKWEAKNLAPKRGESRGYATNALYRSIYIVTPRKSEYDHAVTSAFTADPKRFSRREDLILPELKLPAPRLNYHLAVVDVPLLYGNLIHDGFYHIRANRWITGTTFMYSAANQIRPAFLNRAVEMLEQIPSLKEPRIKRVFANEDEERDYYYSLERSRASGVVREAEALRQDRATASLGSFRNQAGMEIGESWEARNLRVQDLLDRGEFWD